MSKITARVGDATKMSALSETCGPLASWRVMRAGAYRFVVLGEKS